MFNYLIIYKCFKYLGYSVDCRTVGFGCQLHPMIVQAEPKKPLTAKFRQVQSVGSVNNRNQQKTRAGLFLGIFVKTLSLGKAASDTHLETGIECLFRHWATSLILNADVIAILIDTMAHLRVVSHKGSAWWHGSRVMYGKANSKTGAFTGRELLYRDRKAANSSIVVVLSMEILMVKDRVGMIIQMYQSIFADFAQTRNK